MDELTHVPAGSLRGSTAQTAGMARSAAIDGATVGSRALWMGETRVAPGVASAPHHHGESETAIYVVAGHPVFAFRRGEEVVRLATAPGDYVYVPAWVPHVEENPSADTEATVVIARTTQEAIAVEVETL
ncbi:MAG: cupin domain-containing protein [Egibacteraceae bacterium]